MAKKSRVTMRDVAKEAGVSHQTVSRVINNKGEISPETRQHVLDVIEKLNYRPSHAARSISTNKTRTIGLMVPTIANPFFSELVRGAQDVCREEGYNLFLCITNWDQDLEREAINSLASHPADGILICSSRLPVDELTDLFSNGIPHIHDRGFSHSSSRSITIDHNEGCRLALEYLSKLGHKHIALLAGPKTHPGTSNDYRVQAYKRVLKDLKLPLVSEYIVHNPLFPDGGYDGASSILNRFPQVTALLAHNDLVAIGAMRACHDLGYRVPEDCAVIGFSDISLATMVKPSLTTVRVDLYGFGQTQMRALFDLMQDSEAVIEPIYPVQDLIVRESSG
ncbi:MAG: LacI family DNA-binding transcriptional regulator [Anaerolineae bacterium]